MAVAVMACYIAHPSTYNPVRRTPFGSSTPSKGVAEKGAAEKGVGLGALVGLVWARKFTQHRYVVVVGQ